MITELSGSILKVNKNKKNKKNNMPYINGNVDSVEQQCIMC
jgi:hypothetical protein